MRQIVHRFCGIELSGAKSQRTSLVFLDYYVTQQKLFLVDIFDSVLGDEEKNADAVLLEIIKEFNMPLYTIGLGTPLNLPPCVSCTQEICPTAQMCEVPSVVWMRKQKGDITPYTQRPADVFWQDQVMHPLQIHDTLGANRAPLTARAHHLKKQFKEKKLVETEPKLSLQRLQDSIGYEEDEHVKSRDFEQGVPARAQLIEKIAKETGIFIYQRDISKLSRYVSNFDAFITAFTSFLAKHNQCILPPEDFPKKESWIWIPKSKIDYGNLIIN